MKGLVGVAILACSFAIGLWLGRSPQTQLPGSGAESAEVARLFGTPQASAASRSERPPVQTAQAPKATKLRLRSTADVSSREARSGDSVLFVTDQPVQTKAGHHVPAGAIVEAVIAEAKPSSAQKPGSLVIEIRALHVGARTIPLHALPYVPKAIDAAEFQESASRRRLADPRSMRIRTQLRVNSDAVMPKESVVEFELVESVPGMDLLLVPGSPAKPDSTLGDPTPPKSEIPLRSVPDSPRPARATRSRIATDAA